jgi:acetate kinase
MARSRILRPPHTEARIAALGGILPKWYDAQSPPALKAEIMNDHTNAILTINGGSSSIKFALYDTSNPPRQRLHGEVERVGQEGTLLTVQRSGELIQRQPIDGHDATAAARALVMVLRDQLGEQRIVGIGHRIVHGGARLLEHQMVTPELIAELDSIQGLDLPHLPGELALIRAMNEHFPNVPQVACFDTAFHRNLPPVARRLAIPRRFDAAGVRRFGFHGLSYTYLMEALRKQAGEHAADGRIILAHLGNGASMAAVHRGQPIDTSMAFTPTAGLVMGTRPGDIDPGLLLYLMRTEGLDAQQMDEFINKQCGLIGVSETSSDMRDLIGRRPTDLRAAEAVELFCYQARKWIGAFAAAMNGLDTLVFSGGIGTHSPEVRAEICTGLAFLGLQIDAARNADSADLISADTSRVCVRVIATNEELIIARTVCEWLKLSPSASGL